MPSGKETLLRHSSPSAVLALTVDKQDAWSALPFMIDSVKCSYIASLATFSKIRSWSKSLDCLKQFRDKTIYPGIYASI